VTHRDAYLLLFVVALIWAGNFPLAKLGLSELGPMTLAALRALIAAPLLVLTTRVLEGPLPRLARRQRLMLVVQLMRALEIEVMFDLSLELTTVGVGMKEHAEPIAKRVDERHERRGE